MPNQSTGLPDLPDLAGDVRDRVVIAPYDEVSRRVRARRTRGVAGTVAAAVLVVGGIGAWQVATSGSSTREPQPATSSSPVPMTDASMWRSVVESDQSGVFDFAGSYDGSVAVLWRDLVQPEPTFALVIRDPDGTEHGVRLDYPVQLTPVEGGWVGVHVDQGWFIGTDGTWRSLGTPDLPRPAVAGDVVVNAVVPLVYSPTSRTWATLTLEGPALHSYVAPDGALVSCVADGREIQVETDEVPDMSYPGSSCTIAGQGDHVAVAVLGDDPDGSIPLEYLVRSDDSGRSWHDLEVPDRLDISSTTTGTDGTTYVTGTDGRLVRYAPDGVPLELPGEHGVVFTTYDRVCSLAYGQDKGPLACSEDRGETWTETPLPGLE